jgi:preprotein translocase subunit SecG
MLSFAFWALYVFFLLTALILILLVLIQKGRGGGLSSAFGGGGGNTAFGAKTGDVLTWATSIVFGVFMLLAIGLNLVANARQHNLDAQAAAAATVQLPTSPLSGQ